ncbi:hypothetical protein [Aureibacter tunicatorum]|uniref:Uncharacterized protein n=1 Tax=Aureibacter tunicatorum TaxID=866807 RepID=A0AAE4BQ13_9BACT|nr:hypothetical protein [Aureibacter tunicatorum]MDR6238599.1 hypothetical protein [Aureibacter tunicatorum]BDD05470.1 hypothetical protein AUTU_29530 [Aureibacter tunicatorum]
MSQINHWNQSSYNPTDEEILFTTFAVREAINTSAQLEIPFVLNLTDQIVSVKWKDDHSLILLHPAQSKFGHVEGISLSASDQPTNRIKSLDGRLGVVVDEEGIHSVFADKLLTNVGVEAVMSSDLDHTWNNILDYEAPADDEGEIDLNLYVKTINNKDEIIIHSNESSIGAIPTGKFFKPNQKLQYIRHAWHLDIPAGDSKLRLKDTNFNYNVKGEAYDFDGRSLGMVTGFVNDVDIVPDSQMLRYYEYNQLAEDWHRGILNSGWNDKEKANFLLRKFVLEKNLNLIFDPSQIQNNSQRIFIGSGSLPSIPNISVRNLDVKGGAQFFTLFETDSNKLTPLYDANSVSEAEKPFVMFILEIAVNFPYTESVHQIGFPGDNSGTNSFFNAVYPNFYYFNRLEIMLAHEYIHAHQNLIDSSKQGGRDCGFEIKENQVKRAKRELLAYHFTVFPNKVYDSELDDPVFKYTEFVRGVSAKFGNVEMVDLVFWTFKTFQYINLLLSEGVLKHQRDNSYSDFDNDLHTCYEDMLKLKEDLEAMDKGYQILNPDGSYPSMSEWKSLNISWLPGDWEEKENAESSTDLKN